MKAYGITRKMAPCCCPGHDAFSLECYNNRRSKKAHTRMTAVAHRIGRRTNKQFLAKEVRNGEG